MSAAATIPADQDIATDMLQSSDRSEKMGTLSQLDVCGGAGQRNAGPNVQRFCFPENLTKLEATRAKLPWSHRRLFRITCGIYDSIGSIELLFKDKSIQTGEVLSKEFGKMDHGQQLKCSLEVPSEE